MTEIVERVFEGPASRIALVGSNSLLEVVERSVRPFFAPAGTSASTRDWTIEIRDCDSPRGGLASEGYENVAVSDGYELFCNASSTSLVAFAQAAPDSGESIARRLLRAVSRRVALRSGSVPLHAGMVERSRDQAGIVFLGDKRAGKTTSILSALASLRFSFVANDDLLVTASPASNPPLLHATGSPRSVNIRSDVRSRYRELASLQVGVPTKAGMSFLPGDVCRALGSSMIADSRPRALVFPQFSSEVGHSKLVPIEGTNERLQMIERAIDLRAGWRESGLDKYFVPTNKASFAYNVELLAKMPSYRLVQDRFSLETSLTLLDGLDV